MELRKIAETLLLLKIGHFYIPQHIEKVMLVESTVFFCNDSKCSGRRDLSWFTIYYDNLICIILFFCLFPCLASIYFCFIFVIYSKLIIVYVERTIIHQSQTDPRMVNLKHSKTYTQVFFFYTNMYIIQIPGRVEISVSSLLPHLIVFPLCIFCIEDMPDY
jgi:hypothetical protein